MALPYDTARDALNSAIIFADDGGSPAGMAGNILNPSVNPQVIPALQERWRYLQHRLISAGVDTFTKDQIVFALPPSGSGNARNVVILTYQGFFDGLIWHYVTPAAAWDAGASYTAYSVSPPAVASLVAFNNTQYMAIQNSTGKRPDIETSYWVQFTNVGMALPSDLVKPLEAWECASGGNAWTAMTQAPDSLPTHRPIQPRFDQWAFQNDRMVFLPSSQTNDIRIKYLAIQPDIFDLDSPLYVRGCVTALALLVLDQIAGARGGPMADTFKARAEEAINQLINQTVRKMSYAQYVRQPFRGGRASARNSRRSGV